MRREGCCSEAWLDEHCWLLWNEQLALLNPHCWLKRQSACAPVRVASFVQPSRPRCPFAGEPALPAPPRYLTLAFPTGSSAARRISADANTGAPAR